jgi:NitT/TauT family transport system ATP-binding protein
MTGLLELRQVWVEYGDKVVLEKVELSVPQGAFVSVVGPSGAGKSTFLRLVLGQEAPTRGSITLDGKPLRAEPGPDRGVVFQRYSVFPHLNALDNVAFGLDCAGSPFSGRLSGARRGAARDAAAAMLYRVGLAHALDVYPAQLSGGMQQRLAIAQALIMKPRILLLDEPFGALDPGVRLDMHGLITDLWREHGLTILMVTHDIKEAFKLGTRVLAFDKRRHDPQAPNRYGSTVVYDFPLDEKARANIPAALAAMGPAQSEAM